MKRLLSTVLTFALATSAFAAPAPQASSGTGSKSKTRAKKSVNSDIAKDLRELKQALEAQQQQIQQLRQEMQSKDTALQQAQQQAQQAQQQLQSAQTAATEAQQKADAAQSAANEQKETVSKLNSDVTDIRGVLTNNAASSQDEQKRMSALEGLVGRFRFNGDVRVRGENFFQDFAGFQDRNRARIRVRFGFEGKLNEDFNGGIALATGSLGDPTTTNETLTNFFDRETIALDKGYIVYNPVAHKWLNVTAGKFAYTWQRTSATFDPDLNPEGFSEKVSWDFHRKFVKNFNVQLLQLFYNEVTSGLDSYALGAQAGGKLDWGPWSAVPSFTVMKFNNPDAILAASAFAVAANKGGFTSGTPPTTTTVNLPGEGPGCAGGSAGTTKLPSFPNCVFAPNGFTNAAYTDAGGKQHFLSRFLYADFIINNTIKTGISRLPLNVLGEFEENLDAASHPFDTAGNFIPSLGSQNKEYGFDVSIRQTKNKNDFQVGYA